MYDFKPFVANRRQPFFQGVISLALGVADGDGVTILLRYAFGDFELLQNVRFVVVVVQKNMAVGIVNIVLGGRALANWFGCGLGI